MPVRSPPDNFVIRRSVSTDTNAVVRVQFDLYKTAYKGLLPDSFLSSSTLFDNLIMRRSQMFADRDSGDAPALMLVVEDTNTKPEEEIVAFCDAGPLRFYECLQNVDPALYESPVPTILELWTFYVHATLHGTGIAKYLFITTVKKALKDFPDCAGRMIVLTFEGNKPARRFYEKMGGNLCFIAQNYMIDGIGYPVACYGWEDIGYWVNRWEE